MQEIFAFPPQIRARFGDTLAVLGFGWSYVHTLLKYLMLHRSYRAVGGHRAAGLGGACKCLPCSDVNM